MSDNVRLFRVMRLHLDESTFRVWILPCAPGTSGAASLDSAFRAAKVMAKWEKPKGMAQGEPE